MTERTNNNKKVIDYLYQMFLVLLGAGIALGSSWITQSWQHTKERKELVNHIKGSVQNDIKNIDGLTNLLQEYLKEPNRLLSANSFRWQNEATFLQAVANRAGSLDMAVIIELSKYYDMIEQSRAFRRNLRDTLLSNSGDAKKSLRDIQVYFDVLKAQKRVGEDLIKLLEKTYP